ncbi:MAG: hypothetical protein RR396_00025 [Clostridiales bacterium]
MLSLFICHFMKDMDLPLATVWVPCQMKIVDTIVQYKVQGQFRRKSSVNWSVWSNQSASQLKKWTFANDWLRLAAENAPLLAIVNGNILGVPIDFYDFF